MQDGHSQEVKYREDSSNLADDYLRNKIRHQVLPLLKEINPQWESTMNNSAQRIRDREALALKQAEQLKSSHIRQEKEELYINLGGLKKEKITSTILYYLLSEYGFNEDQASEILLLKETNSGRRFFTDMHKAVLNRGRLIIDL